MKKFLLVFIAMACSMAMAIGQRIITGTVVNENGDPLIGANVVAKGTAVGTVTDVNGYYSLNLPAGSNTIVVSYVGYTEQEAAVGVSNVLNFTLAEGVELGETVITALGISRYKNELAYSAQKLESDDVSRSRDGNIVNALSGKVAGLYIKKNNTLGGSTNMVLRGAKSLTGDNQALIIVDGVAVDNSNTNTSNQKRGRLGYDYGNAAADINPNDVENVTILKGAAASALYGSRAANGVVLITTKKGGMSKELGVQLNYSISVGNYDKSTFAEYQKEYGAGYGLYYEDPSGYFLYRDINGDGTDDLVAPLSEDASYGGRFDPNLLVYQWDSFDPSSPNYGKPHPWVAAANGAEAIFETAVTSNAGVVIDKAFDKGYFKLGYNYSNDKGIMPNSEIEKNQVNFGAGYDLSDKVKVFSSINYSHTNGLGRYGTGYDSKNLMTMMRQWWQVNVDLKDQEAAYERTKQNVTWNWADPTDLNPIYWDNVYWTRHENYQNDARGRYFGNIGFEYKPLSWLNVKATASLDKYSEYQEERIAIGSIDVSEYQRLDRNFEERNYTLLLTTKSFDLTSDLKFSALAGGNVWQNEVYYIRDKTNGGLSIPRLYSLSNSVNPRNAAIESLQEFQVNGLFGGANFNYDNWLFLDLTMRRDQASSLPKDNNTYYYPSASLGLNFTKFIGASDVFTFGKLRVNYAEVGNTAPPLSVNDVYNLGVNTILDRTVAATSWNGVTLTSTPITKNNPDLKPERTKSSEIGLELKFLESRLGLDLTYYKMNTVDQILPAAVSRATGYSAKYINAGEIENKGFELQLFVKPVQTQDFDWTIDLNWSKNESLVKDLGGIDNLLLASFQGGVSINATLNEPYGTIRGSNFVFHDGQRVVNNSGSLAGFYKISATSNEVIGDVNPDWIGGVFNRLRYKNFDLSFLVDIKQGGDMFSLDLYYGLATGLYPETVGNNDLGNPVRDAKTADDKSGGVIFDGVKENADGTFSTNDLRVSAQYFGTWGYRRNPAARFIYDASYVKLRELNLNYTLPASLFQNSSFIKGATIGLFGRNLWIISKNMKYSDPEDGLSSGNVQGYQVGVYPTAKVMGVNFNLKF
ncbi:MAG: SusC/RagA family TonB-linked outer membrane protein [Saprospiraceae bacterium]|nr:SusC/RagA family TonB-linked outer membrane protein [Saprospiraceae bacterium]